MVRGTGCFEAGRAYLVVRKDPAGIAGPIVGWMTTGSYARRNVELCTSRLGPSRSKPVDLCSRKLHCTTLTFAFISHNWEIIARILSKERKVINSVKFKKIFKNINFLMFTLKWLNSRSRFNLDSILKLDFEFEKLKMVKKSIIEIIIAAHPSKFFWKKLKCSLGLSRSREQKG